MLNATANRRTCRAPLRTIAITSQIVLLAWLTFIALPARAETSAPAVKTRQGEVRGKLDGNVREFFGIPYAAPPVGDLRWRSPHPHANWTSILDATMPGNSCPQVRMRRGGTAGSEDCLYLNIYTPDSPTGALPVMVWIHGGTFVAGSGASYNGHDLAEKGHLIVVTINYRLGPFGFLAHRGLDTTDASGNTDTSGNYGLLDQQAALRWVKDNIASFGGDPHKVTVAGESAGAISVGIHLLSPAAAGLFSGAILESGPFLHFPTLAEAEVRGDEFAAKLDCGGIHVAACMRAKPAEEVLNALPASPISIGEPVWFPTVDGHVIPSQPADAMAAGHLNKVPIINGSNRDEGTLFVAFGKPVTAQEFTSGVQKRFGSNAPRVLAAYPPDGDRSPSEASAAGLGDALFSCRVLKASELLSAWLPVYQYEFNDPHAPNAFAAFAPNATLRLGAYHSSEIQYVLGTVLKKSNSLTPEQRKLADDMMGYWIRFISTGDPGGNSPRWNPYTAADPRILSLTPGAIKFATDFAKTHHCDLWDSLQR